MTNSSTYISILDKGKEIGKGLDNEKGKEKNSRSTNLCLGGIRFVDPSIATVERVEAIHSSDILTLMIDKVLVVETWEEFFEA